MENVWQFLLENPLIELWFVTLILVVVWYIWSIYKQPVLIWYIIWWLLLWPQMFDVIQHQENIAFYAHFWVSLLLFMVGLGLNPGIIKEVWKVSTIAWVGQVLFTSFIWYGVSLLLWFSPIVSLFIAIALTFSSTIVIVKLISDRWDAWTMYGKISLGILIVQDIIAMLILLVISAFSMHTIGDPVWPLVWLVFIKVVWLLFWTWAFAKYILPRVMNALVSQKELLLLFVITCAILSWWLWYFAGFSMEIWSLLAWVTLASSRYRFHILSELRPFRDLFLALFFVYLGWQIVFDSIWVMLLPILLLSVFVLIWNPIIVVTLMMKLWYAPKDSFMTWLTVAQISEFSFIVVWLALWTWIIQDPNILSLVTIIGLITMTWSSYMFAQAEKIFSYVSPFLYRLRKKETHQKVLPDTHIYTIIIIWYGRLWKYIASKLKHHQIPFCVIDNDISKVKLSEKAWYDTIYWDIEDNDTLSTVISKKTELVYSTIDHHDVNIHLLTMLKDDYDYLKTVLVALYIDEAENLYNHWADYVIFPHLSGAYESWEVLEKHVREPDQFILSKIKNIEALQMHRVHILDT